MDVKTETFYDKFTRYFSETGYARPGCHHDESWEEKSEVLSAELKLKQKEIVFIDPVT